MNLCKNCVHWYHELDDDGRKHRCLELESVLSPEEDCLYTSPEFGCNLWTEAPQALIDSYPIRVAEA